MTFLSLFEGGDRLVDRMRHAARARVVVDVVKELQAEADRSLREAADAEQARTGTAFTARDGGVTALVTDPRPKPQMAVRDAFARWFADAYPDDVETVERVQVLDHEWLARTVDAVISDPSGDDEAVDTSAREALLGALKITTDVVLPEKALDLTYDRGRLHVTDDAVVEVVTGERVPGLTVTKAKPTLQVRLEKGARADAQRLVRDVLGLPDEIGGR